MSQLGRRGIKLMRRPKVVIVGPVAVGRSRAGRDGSAIAREGASRVRDRSCTGRICNEARYRIRVPFQPHWVTGVQTGVPLALDGYHTELS